MRTCGISGVVNCLIGVMLLSSNVWAGDEADKLKQLERAMTAPTEKKMDTKPHPGTRAIKFDPVPPGAAEQSEVPRVEPVQAVKAVECGVPAADAKITAVDFAIQFKIGSAELTAPSEKTLQQISKILALSNSCILIEGHTDSLGNAERNLELSRQRAASVVKFISGKDGISQARLVPVGKGSSEPAKNLDSRNPLNRRVVFKVVG